jgi:hypothetical protein
VTSGSEGYSTGTDGFGTGGLDGSFNGAIQDYAFHTTGTGSLVESLGGAADLITTTNAGGQSSDSPGIDIWAGSSTAGAADQTTWSRPGTPVGSVDISGLTSGSLYMFFGTRVGAGDTYDITFSLSDSNETLTPLNLSEVGINTTSQGGTANNTWFVYRADFADAAGYDTLTFSYDMTSSNTQARHRWSGVVLTAGGEPSNTFANWIDDYPGAASDTSFGGDPDGDGKRNGVENYFGTNPGEADPDGLVAVGVTMGESNTFSFTHPLNATPADDLTATYLWSNDLATFHDDGESNGAGTTTVSFAQGAPSGGMVSVTATITGTEIPDRLFVVLAVTQP